MTRRGIILYLITVAVLGAALVWGITSCGCETDQSLIRVTDPLSVLP